ncbi:MAG TPA: hypothetical protein VGS79_17040 [Puia sp.]|nr:hypothetical protein [Puia sp.]
MYLLLRNNKQSGPYSLEELKSMGLKAYDLVWLEGKSAAWRYPSELEELKPFAPAVEEQPFDRFYRRPTPTTTTATNPAAATLNTKAPAADTPIPVSVESSKAPGKRIIYVTMPAARNTSAREPVQPAREPVQPARETIQPVREPVQPVREAAHLVPETTQLVLEPVQSVREAQPLFREDLAPVTEPAYPTHAGSRVIEDYSAHQAGDQTIVEEFFPRKKRSPGVVRLLAIAICILALLAAGIIIGLNLNKNTLGFPSRVVAKMPPANPNLSSGASDQTIVHPTAQQLPSPVATTPATTTDPMRAADPGPGIGEQPNATLPAVAKATTKNPGFKTQKERPSHAKPNSLSPAKDSAGGSTLASAVHRADVAEPYHNNTELADKEAIKAALASEVSVGTNGYSVGTFGGITDLQLTVTNRSVYPLDLVIVEVQYIQANKKIFKTENLYFRSIGAGSALMQEAPKSSRGVRVQYKIMSITSKEVAYSSSGI